ncbi:MAG: sugar phosphate isomerase/epimerase family protein [Verrucomicrobiota bacterium]
MNRRHFVQTTVAAAALAAVTPALAAEAKAKRTNKRGIMWATVGIKGSILDKMKAVKEAGFDGVEMMSHLNQEEVLKAREAVGLEILSVCGEKHWGKPLSSPDAAVREEGLAALKQTLRDAKAYGTNSILLVPGTVNAKVNFDDCWKISIEEIRKAIPLAQELGVKISIENVWNNFIEKPEQAVRYLEEINSPWVGWHFDCGNVIRFGDPIAWIKALGPRINRVHLKEYSLDRSMRAGDVWKGFNAPLLEGANNWAGIMKALDAADYTGPVITEQGGGSSPEGLKNLLESVNKILAS